MKTKKKNKEEKSSPHQRVRIFPSENKEDYMGYEYDEAVLKCFLKQQDRLFPEPVAEGLEEAEAFLEDCMAVVVDSKAAVMEYFEEAGIDVENPDQVLDEAEVFDVGDGRYLIVEG